jgi:hypothetical protein
MMTAKTTMTTTMSLTVVLYRFCFFVLVAVDDGENDGDEAVKK